jgi:hypothetical protein
MRLGACLLGFAIMGCGSSDAVATTPADAAGALDVGRTDGGVSGTSIGSGTLAGPETFAVTTVRWTDPGPFSEKARLEVYLSNDAACGRPKTCAPYQELMLRMSSPKAGTITAGVYSVITPMDAGVAGSLEARWVNVRPTDGCRVTTQPGPRGTVTIEAIDGARVKGTFEIDMMLPNGMEPRWTGSFEALHCP